MKEINKITRVNVKEVWRYEDKDLTPWLCDNIDVVGEAIGLQLANAVKEQSTGNFSVDIKAEDIEGKFAVIENQFGSSDHDHLGKLITYLAAFEAKYAIWIVSNARNEHINAINWLNESSNNCYFYLLKLEAIRIGDSQPAPLLTKIVGPSDEARKLGAVKKEDEQRFSLRQVFWDQLLTFAKKEGLVSFSSISPVKDAWISAASGIRGLSYAFWVNQESTRIELRIDRGKGSEQENINILNELKKHQVEIEKDFEDNLTWADLEGYRVCSIRKDYRDGGYKSDQSTKYRVIHELVRAMIRLENATKPLLNAFKLK